jgi:glutamate---cysteine ligase / carboxylate-amine ligase
LTKPPDPDVTAEGLERTFDAADPLTVGIEEEVMLLDPATLDLSPGAAQLLERLKDDPRFKPELPASQLEIITPVRSGAAEVVADLAQGRRDLASALGEDARAAVAGVHPFAAAEGELSRGERFERVDELVGPLARLQLVAALQVHVAVGGAERTLAVYNALRPRLPELAALAANASVYGGRDTGLASVRPKIAELLPRQGLPPEIRSWSDYADELRWGAASGSVPLPRFWWWELRPHPAFGTLELRVPDAQTTLAEAAGVIATAQALVAQLAERHDAGEAAPSVPHWRIEENRWSAARHGIEGRLADLETGERKPTRERLAQLLDELAPRFADLGSDHLMPNARALVEENGAMRQRAIFKRDGAEGVARMLAERFGELEPGLEPHARG